MPQLNFPAIGYHNMKENNFISIAKNMMHTGNFIDRSVYYKNAFEDKKDFGEYPQIPFVSYQIILGYKLFGDNLWFPRLVNIMFMVFSIIVMFLLAHRFTKEYIYSVFTSLLMSILPLGIYCSRNLQPESGAFFFMLLGNLFFIKFIQKFKKHNLVLFSFCFAMTLAYKGAFLFGFLPCFFIFPYRRYLRHRNLKAIITQVGLVLFPVAVLISYWVVVGQINIYSEGVSRVDLLRIFSKAYWDENAWLIWRYTKRENFTLVYFLLFIGAMIRVWFSRIKDKVSLANYLRAWSIGVVIYCVVFSDFINKHNYYQMPFLGFVSLSIVYFLKEISCFFSRILRINMRKEIFSVIFALVFALSFSAAQKTTGEQFSTIFPGGDIVGRLIKDLTTQEDRIFIFTGPQGYSSCTYAERKCGWVDSLEEFKATEEKFKIRYVVVYPISFFKDMKTDIKDYVFSHYHVKFVGVSMERDTLTPLALVLEQGGTVEDLRFFSKNNKYKLRQKTVYETVFLDVPFLLMEATREQMSAVGNHGIEDLTRVKSENAGK